MQVNVSGRAGGADYADLAIVAPFGVVLLDGASAFEPVDVNPGTYALMLGKAITARLHRSRDLTIADAVAEAIRHTAATLHLTPGASPSSTVAVLRARSDVIDLYALGDSPIHYGVGHHTHQLVDDRLANVAVPERERYLERLRAGHGYDDAHRAALAELQQAQRHARNVEGGYWIAETDPSAAHHARTLTLDRATIEWAVLATDGAADVLRHLGKDDWPTIARLDDTALAALLADLHEWEAQHDPDGEHLPRAKRHDDKTIAAVSEV
jgi:hypothetical protein